MMWTAVPLIRMGPGALDVTGVCSYSYSRLSWAVPG
jgi:hypothetical protein